MSADLEHLLFAAHDSVVEEIRTMQEKARRYDALYRFIDDTDVGYIMACAVYPELSEQEGDDLADEQVPPAPEHLKAEGGDLVASYGLGLEALCDFLDANRGAGKFADPDEYKRRPPRDLTKSERQSAKAREDL